MLVIDSDGCEWVPNWDGQTFRCLSAEIESLTLEEIDAEFGPVEIRDRELGSE